MRQGAEEITPAEVKAAIRELKRGIDPPRKTLAILKKMMDTGQKCPELMLYLADMLDPNTETPYDLVFEPVH